MHLGAAPPYLCLLRRNFCAAGALSFCFSGAIFGLDMKTCFNGVFADADKFNKKVNYFFLGCGTEEQMGTKKMVDSLRKLGIEVDYYESQGTAHEWLTWRRCLKEFVPHLFKH